MLSDLRHALRSLARVPGFTAVAVLTLALGIGACTAIFSIINGVLLRPLGFRNPRQLVWLQESAPAFGTASLPVNAHHFLIWRERAKSFAGLSVIAPGSVNLTGLERPEQLSLVGVSTDFFELLGTPPALGRGFLPGEETGGRNQVVVISDALWRRNFSADPSVVGRKITLDGVPHTVVGVLPSDFQFAHVRQQGGSPRPDVFRPKVFDQDELRELLGRHNYGTIARLRPGVTLGQAEAELNGIATQITREAGHPDFVLRALVEPLQEAVVGQSRRGLLVLFAAVASVLLIACVNLMNFLLAQAERRSGEFAVRRALGAGRFHLLRQALIEALVVAFVGGALGVLFAEWGLDFLLRLAPADLPRLAEVRLDTGVLLFALAATLCIGLLFSLAPAWLMMRADPREALSTGNRTITGGRRRWSNTLVAAEVALSLMLLATAALFARSFIRLLRTEQGFSAPTVLSGEVAIPFFKYQKPEQRTAFFEEVVRRLANTPGVAAAAIINALPLQGETWVEKAYASGDPRPMEEKSNVNVRFISPAYFQTLGIPLLTGRIFNEADHDRPVAIISRQLAQILWPGHDPLGRRIERSPGDQYEVIGVADDVRPAANRAPVPTVYRPHWEWAARRMTVTARAAEAEPGHVLDPHALASALRNTIRATDRDVPIPALRSMTEILDESIAPQLFQLRLAGIFAGTALLLTSLGIYGVIAYSVARRQRELGVRLAFGAAPSDVRRLVIGQGMRPVLAGLAAGLAIAFATGRVLNTLLYDTSATDPLTLAFVVTVLIVVALLACWLPASKATRVNPIEALHAE